jgi:precorrin-2 dehydrogenase / sirohydrochlorin ferrochelatase
MVALPSYPVNLVLEGRRVLVVGGGKVAAHKVAALVEAGAVVTVVAPEAVVAITSRPAVTHEARPYRSGEVEGYRLVVAATDDPAVNQAVYEDGEAAGVWVNVADEPERCSFTLPAVLRRGPVQLTASTGGTSPALAGWLRDRIDAAFGPELETIAETIAEERAAVKAAGRPTDSVDWRARIDALADELVVISEHAATPRLERQPEPERRP